MFTGQLGGVLLQYACASPQQLFPNIVADFHSVAKAVSEEQLRHGLISALHAGLAELVEELFRQSGVHERVAILEILKARLEENSLESCLQTLACSDFLGLRSYGVRFRQLEVT